MSQPLRVEQLVDEQSIGRFNVQLLIWSFLAMFADGYDLSAMPFAAPSLVREWHLQAAVFGPVFSASLSGILFGAPLMGWVGDRFGRRIAISAGCVLYGLSTLAMVFAHSSGADVRLRVITGIGLGGLMPNTIALSSELSPKRWRATLVVLMFTGITLGSGTPGPGGCLAGARLRLAGAVRDRRARAARSSPPACLSCFRNPSSSWRCTPSGGPSCCKWRAASGRT